MHTSHGPKRLLGPVRAGMGGACGGGSVAIRLAPVTPRVTLPLSARRKRLVCVISFLGCFWLAGGFSSLELR